MNKIDCLFVNAVQVNVNKFNFTTVSYCCLGPVLGVLCLGHGLGLVILCFGLGLGLGLLQDSKTARHQCTSDCN